jgi:hypothetical protein
MSDVQFCLGWLIALSVLVVVILAWACVALDRINQRIVKLEVSSSYIKGDGINEDLRLVWDKIGSLDADNAGLDYRITKLESEEYFGDEDDSDYDEENPIHIFVESAVEAGHFVHLGVSYRVTLDKNEG